MHVPFVDLKAQYQSIREDLDSAIESVIAETAFIGGRRIKSFEAEFAQAQGAKHCIGVANGTDAIFIALKMLGVGPGDEVITVANSWISTSETISQTGAKPVFVDIDDYYNIDVDLIAAAITEKTKAIVPVHIYGQPADIQTITDLCNQQGLLLLEDCAQAHLAAVDGKLVGNFGQAGTFSFYPGKNLGAYGDAGAIVTNDDDLADRMRMFANHGALKKHEHIMEGINSRLDGLQAAILSAKLPHLAAWTASRRQVAARYEELLNDIDGLTLPDTAPGRAHVHHLYVVRCHARDALRQHLSDKGVETGIHYPTPLPLLPAYRYLQHTAEQFPRAAKCQKEILSLPMFPELTDDQIEYVANSIREYFGA
jgi:dTDP-4-amino-4,6-dideoxygalactose transaminase